MDENFWKFWKINKLVRKKAKTGKIILELKRFASQTLISSNIPLSHFRN